MQKMVIAVDVDGTLFDGSGVADEAIEALRQATADGHTLVIVTGRRWEGLDLVIPDVVVLAERVVCEEGAVMVDVADQQVTLLAAPVDQALIAAPCRRGRAGPRHRSRRRRGADRLARSGDRRA